MKGDQLYDWSLLNRELSEIHQSVIRGWKDLVVSGEREPRYQKFLSDHAGIFFGGAGTSLVINQLQLGTERRPDLVIVHDNRSGGLHYEFIELKRPSHGLFTSKGLHSEHLRMALEQVDVWKHWLDERREFVREFLPAKDYAGRSCSFKIYIGTRSNTTDRLAQRNAIPQSKNYPLQVRSYDSLTDDLVGRQFRHSCPASWVNGDELTLNRLANPFFRAFSDKAWRRLLKSLEQSSYEGLSPYQLHFLSGAGKKVVEHRKSNSLFDEFVSRLSQLKK